jgi:hypothetical protein
MVLYLYVGFYSLFIKKRIIESLSYILVDRRRAQPWTKISRPPAVLCQKNSESKDGADGVGVIGVGNGRMSGWLVGAGRRGLT